MEASAPGSHAPAADAVHTHIFSFNLLPLKASNQPSQGLKFNTEQQDAARDANSPLKAARAGAAAASSSSPSASAAAQQFLQQLSAYRREAMAVLSNTSSSTAAVQAAVNRYLSAMLDLAGEGGTKATAAAQQQQQQDLQGDLMEEYSSTQLPDSAPPGSMQQQQPPSRLKSYLLRHSLVFEWADTLLQLSSSSSRGSSSWWPSSSQQAGPAEAGALMPCRDVLHEAAALMLAAATWHMAKGTELVSSAAADGISSATAMEAYKQQRTAAGLLQAIQGQLPQLVGWLGWDLQQELLAGLQNLALAYAQRSSGGRMQAGAHICLHTCRNPLCLAAPQSLTLQRAIAKSHQPSLVSAIATDTAGLFCSALQSIQAAIAAAAQQLQGGAASLPPASAGIAAAACTPAAFERAFSGALPSAISWGTQGRHLPKLLAFLKYQVAYCYAVAAVYAADASLDSGEAGTAVAWGQEAARIVKYVYTLGVEFDRLSPPTSREQRQQLERSLDAKVQATLGRCVRDNNSVYFQPVPKQLPALPAPKRAVEAIPFQMPPAANQVTSGLAAQLVAAVSGRQAGTSSIHLEPHGTLPAASGSAGSEAALHAAAAAAAGAGAGPGSSAGTAGAAHAAAPHAVPGEATDKEEQQAAHASSGSSGGRSCWRMLVMVVCYPLLILVSLLGILLWLLLLPFKLCCCCLPCACAVQLMWNVMEYIIKAPLNAAIWAAGAGGHGSAGYEGGKHSKGSAADDGKAGGVAGSSGARDIEAP